MRAFNKKFDFLLVPFLFLPLLLIWMQDITVTLYNIDDLYLKTIASGEFTGIPQAHLVHVGYLTGLLLQGLYTLAPSMPWYGLLLFTYGYLGIYLSLYFISAKIKKQWHRILYFCFWTFVSFAFLWLHLVELQYTTVTAIVCGAGIVCFYLSEDREHPKEYLKANLPALLFFFLALELRDKACIMFFPLIFLIGAVKCIRKRNMFKPVLTCGVVLLLMTALVYGINFFAYSDPDWASFDAYNTARENVVDYNGYPDYEAHREDYEALGITYDSYIAASSRYQLLLDENIDTGFMLRMEELSNHHALDLRQMATAFLNRHTTDYMDRPLNIVVYILYFFALLSALVCKNKKALRDIVALFGGRMIIWTYLLFVNRPEARVTQGVYIVEFLLLVAILFANNLFGLGIKQEKKIKLSRALFRALFKKKRLLFQRSLLVLFCAITVFAGIRWGLPHIDLIMRYSRERVDFACAYREMRTYFYEHEENLYLVDTNAFTYFTEDAFLPTMPSKANFVLLGSWTANSPWTDSIAEQFDIVSYETDAIARDDIYFVFLKGDNTDHYYLEEYYQSKYPNTYFEQCDTVCAPNGLEFYIMQVKEKR